MAQKPIDPELRFIVIGMFVERKHFGLPAPKIREVSAKIKVSMGSTYDLMRRLVAAGLIDPIQSPGGPQVWFKRPYSSKPDAIRQRAWRAAKKKAAASFQEAAASNATREETPIVSPISDQNTSLVIHGTNHVEIAASDAEIRMIAIMRPIKGAAARS